MEMATPIIILTELGHTHGNPNQIPDELGPTWQLITPELQRRSRPIIMAMSAIIDPRPNQGRRPGLGRHENVKGLRPNGNG